MSSSNKSNTVLQLVLSTLVVLSAWGAAFLLVVIGVLQGLQSDFDFNLSLPIFILAAVSFTTGCLVVPSAFFSLQRLQGKQDERVVAQSHWMRSSLLVLLFACSVWLGDLAAESQAAWLLLPFFHILAIGIPVLWLLSLAVRNLPLGSMQRRWGVFASGLVLGPTLIMIAELFAVIGLLVAAGVWLSAQPQLFAELSSLADKMASSPASPDELVELMLPYLLTPAVLGVTLFFTALVVPLIEEFLKPVGVWLLMGRKLTPAAGFAAGAISGAGYALFESLLLTSGGDNWSTVVLARLGTTSIHMLTSAMTGWALVGVWQKKQFLRLVGVYLAAVIFHGLWNGMTVFSVFTSLEALAAPTPGFTSAGRIGGLAPYALGLFSVLAFAAIIWANRQLARSNTETQELAAVIPQP